MSETFRKSVMIYVAAMFLLAFAMGPFCWMLLVSFSDRPDILQAENVEYSFSNFREVMTAESLHFTYYLKNSLIVSFAASIIVTLITAFAAYAISRLRFPGRNTVPLVVLAASMFPQISVIGFLFDLFSRLGLINTCWALLFPYIAWTIPTALWINMSYFSQIPLDLDKAALVDGAGRTKILTGIILPLALPGIFSSFLLVFIACFNEFLFAVMLTVDYTAQTLPVGIAMFQGLHGEIPWGNVMAASAIASVPLVVMTIIFQRYIVRGLMGGAVKG